MSIRIKCAGCGKTIKALSSHLGKKIKCPGCGASLRVPETDPTAPGNKGPSEKIDDVVEAVAEVFIPPPSSVEPQSPELPPQPEMQPVSYGNSSIELTRQPGTQEVHLTRVRLPVMDIMMLIITFWVATFLIAVGLFFVWLFFGALIMAA